MTPAFGPGVPSTRHPGRGPERSSRRPRAAAHRFRHGSPWPHMGGQHLPGTRLSAFCVLRIQPGKVVGRAPGRILYPSCGRRVMSVRCTNRPGTAGTCRHGTRTSSSWRRGSARCPNRWACWHATTCEGNRCSTSAARSTSMCRKRWRLVGVDNEQVLCELCDPPMSSVAPNPVRIGYEAAALLDRLMAGAKAPSAPILIPPLGVVARQSSDITRIDRRRRRCRLDVHSPECLPRSDR